MVLYGLANQLYRGENAESLFFLDCVHKISFDVLV